MGLAEDLPRGLDDFAAMILLCCNPELSEKAQLCLMLKAGCGLSVREISRALGMAHEAVKKAITRAKDKIACDGADFGALDRRPGQPRWNLRSAHGNRAGRCLSCPNLTWLGLLGGIVAVRLHWYNSTIGYWLNLAVV